MKVVLLDTGRGRTEESVELWRSQLELTDSDELALISWNHPKRALPVVDQLVFGPTFDGHRREPARPNVTLSRRIVVPGGGTSTADLPRTDPRRLLAAARWRLRRLDRATARLQARTTDRLPHPLDALSGSSPLGQRARKALKVSSDGVATDFALAVARSAQAAELAAWADVLVPFDARSRKAAWVLAQRVEGPYVPSDVTSAKSLLASVRTPG
ncbi:MAG: hypothetical protein Q4G43_10340 [Mobilicoccus sp.]|nr:hypothetical protein [Mobilicoccus sp.]